MATDDKEIINLIGRDPNGGFRQLMGKYQEAVYWHVRRMVVSRDDAQDVAQETFVRVYRSLRTYRGECSLRSWIYRIATNEALRVISNRRQEMVSLDSESTGAELIAAGDYVDYDNAVAVKFQKAILTLPPKQQLAFNLKYYDEMSFEEISQVAGTTPSSVKVSYHVAKDKIIAYMNSND